MNIRFSCLLVFFAFVAPARGQQAITVYSLNGDTLLDNIKYTNVQAAVNACPTVGCIIRVPTGTWPTSSVANTGLTINQSFVHILCSGIGITTISYTGTLITAVVDIGTSTTGSPGYVVDSINGCTINGNGDAQYAIRTRGVHHSDFSHNSLINVKDAGFESNFGVVLTLDDIHVSLNEVTFSTTPANCMILDGPDSNHKTTATHVGQPICEGVSGTGIVLNNTGDVTVQGGTSEQNIKGITLSSGAVGDRIYAVDTEANTTSNIEDGGFQNKIQDVVGNGKVIVLGTASGSTLAGHFFDSITIDSGAVNTSLVDVAFNNSGSGGFANSGSGTVMNGVYNLVGSVYIDRGSCVMSADTRCTATVPSGFSKCIAMAQGTTAIAGACSISGTTLMVTAASSNSATWAYTILN
jgi:hypothetical protein